MRTLLVVVTLFTLSGSLKAESPVKAHIGAIGGAAASTVTVDDEAAVDAGKKKSISDKANACDLPPVDLSRFSAVPSYPAGNYKN